MSAGCKACQIIIDASLESISCSTREALLAEIGFTDEEGSEFKMDEECLCACVMGGSFLVYMSAMQVLSFDVSKKNPPADAGSHFRGNLQEQMLTGADIIIVRKSNLKLHESMCLY